MMFPTALAPPDVAPFLEIKGNAAQGCQEPAKQRYVFRASLRRIMALLNLLMDAGSECLLYIGELVALLGHGAPRRYGDIVRLRDERDSSAHLLTQALSYD